MRLRTVYLFLLCLLPLAGRAQWHGNSPVMPSPRAFAQNSAGDRLWLSASGAGLWHSTNAGVDWWPVQARLPVDRGSEILEITTLDQAAETLWVRAQSPAGTSSISHSLNGGAVWDSLRVGMPGSSAVQLVIWPADHRMWLALVGPSAALWRSTNYGQSWNAFPIGAQNPKALVQSPLNESTLYVVTDYRSDSSFARHGGVLRSTDLGITWQDIADLYALFGINYAFPRSLAALSNGHLLFFVGSTFPQNEVTNQILISTNQGASWELFSTPLPENFQLSRVIEDRSSPGTLLASSGAGFGLYRSPDYGASWQICGGGLPLPPYSINSLVYHPARQVLSVAIAGVGIFESADHGVSWQPRAYPPIGSAGRVRVINQTVFATDHAGRQWLLEPPYADWYRITLPPSPDTLVNTEPVIYRDNSRMLMPVFKQVPGRSGSLVQMAVSTNGGATWTYGELVPFPQAPWFSFAGRGGPVLLTYNRGGVCYSLDTGRTWQANGFPQNLNSTAFAANAVHMVVAGWRSGAGSLVFRSADLGATWDSLRFSGGTLYSGVDLTLTGADIFLTAYVRSGLYGCWWWSDGEWRPRGGIPDFGSNFMLEAIPGWPNPVLIGLSSDNRLWFSRDFAQTWEDREIELPFASQNPWITDFTYDSLSNRLWAATTVGPCYLDLNEIGLEARPLRFLAIPVLELSVSPNPFNCRVSIQYNLPQSGPVSLDLYDLLGRHVRTLVKVFQTAGAYNHPLDSQGLAGGLYFVRLQAGSHQRIQKLVLLK